MSGEQAKGGLYEAILGIDARLAVARSRSPNERVVDEDLFRDILRLSTKVGIIDDLIDLDSRGALDYLRDKQEMLEWIEDESTGELSSSELHDFMHESYQLVLFEAGVTIRGITDLLQGVDVSAYNKS